jgi:acylphosphatase
MTDVTASPPPERLEAQVWGRVQGVGFRYFTQREATRLGLGGYVRNGADGRRVEVVAEGSRMALDRLVLRLNDGPQGAYVERVDVSWGPGTGEFGAFTVRH